MLVYGSQSTRRKQYILPSAQKVHVHENKSWNTNNWFQACVQVLRRFFIAIDRVLVINLSKKLLKLQRSVSFISKSVLFNYPSLKKKNGFKKFKYVGQFSLFKILKVMPPTVENKNTFLCHSNDFILFRTLLQKSE